MHVTEDTCRVCLGKQRLNSIFEKKLEEKIKFCASVELSEEDEYPKMICNQCLFYLDVAYIFRTVCEATDLRLRKLIKQPENDAPSRQEGDYYFDNSPVGHEVVIGEERENDFIDSEVELSGGCNEIVAEDGCQTTPDSKTDDLEENKEKIGRHTAKKISARAPKRVPPVHEDKLDQERNELDEETNEQNEESNELDEETNEVDEETDLLRHSRAFPCDQCNKSFNYQSHLARHMTVHLRVKNYSCQHCGKKFINRYNLSVHLQKHTGDFPYKCALCARGFSVPSLLKRHLQSHSLNPEFECKFCSKKMMHLSSLRLHEKMHLYRPAYTCDICFKTFSYTSSLECHKKAHQGIKENSCEVCGKKFSRKTSLRRHMATHISKKTNNKSGKLRAKKFECEECNQRFTSKSLLIEHLKDHVGLKPP